MVFTQLGHSVCFSYHINIATLVGTFLMEYHTLDGEEPN